MSVSTDFKKVEVAITNASPMTKFTRKKFDLNEQLDLIKSAVPVSKLDDVEEEEDQEIEKTMITKSNKSRVLDEEDDSESEPFTHTTILDMSKIAKLKVVKGIVKNR